MESGETTETVATESAGVDLESIGRPTRLTPEVHQRIVESIQAGNYARVAAKAADIEESTFYRWLQRGKAELRRMEAARKRGDEVDARPRPREAKFVSFFKAVKQAEAAGEERLLAIISNAAIETWQAAAWTLERKHPDRYGVVRNVKMKVEEETEKVIERLRAKLAPEVFDEVLRAIAEPEGDGAEDVVGAEG